MSFDLLSTVEQGGCSAKLSPTQLAAVLSTLKLPSNENLLVDTSTHDDAGVYKLTNEIALIQTVDFFPPVCSDPYDFGQIAAANGLSDVYAMGGTPLTALNIVLFPSAKIPLEVLGEILRGGLDKVTEAGAVIAGGHTIDDFPPKYGLAVTGVVHPSRIVTNAGAKPGDALILTKPIGTGVIIAGKRVGQSTNAEYHTALQSMKLLNKAGAAAMQEYGVHAATDITGYGLIGHAKKMADASGVSMVIRAAAVPFLSGAYRLADLGCLPGAAFRNLEFAESSVSFPDQLDYNLKMLLADAQTSGGLFMAAPKETANRMVSRMCQEGFPNTAIIGEVIPKTDKSLMVR
jgi:selenide, water dikinase